MRKAVLFIGIFVSVLALAQIPHKYYVGDIEVSEVVWSSIPDSIRAQSACEKWDYDTIIIERIFIPLRYKLDTTDVSYSIKMRSDSEMAEIRRNLPEVRSQSTSEVFKLKVGDISPNFSVVNNLDGSLTADVLRHGKCYLINFWATWCGNCLLELRPSEIPLMADKFKDDENFVFLPVCIDASLSDLETFFNSERGAQWIHLKDLTFLDIDRAANGVFAESGNMPLTVVVGRSGRIEYLRVGRLSTAEHFKELEKAIMSGLENAE